MRGNSLITLPSYDPSYVSSVAKVVHWVVVWDRWRIWPTSVSHEVITTKDFEARTNTATQLSYAMSVKKLHASSLQIDLTAGCVYSIPLSTIATTAPAPKTFSPCSFSTPVMPWTE